MQTKISWPKGPFFWRGESRNYCSIPFTWNIKPVRKFIAKHGGLWSIGGPACDLIPFAFSDMQNVMAGGGFSGILQKLNPHATRTTTGCPNSCQFCGIGQKLIEPFFDELDDWPDLPIICDNNLLGASERHLQRVFERLRWWGWADFNQGLDCRKITPEIASELNSIGKPIARIALDGWSVAGSWVKAINLLREAGFPKRRIHSYVMIGYGDEPARDIDRIQFAKNILSPACVNAMWFHELDAVKSNVTTENQAAYGWSDRLRIDTMRWSYGRAAKPKYSPTLRINRRK